MIHKLILHRYKVNVRMEDGTNSDKKIGVIAGSFGEAEEILMDFRQKHNLDFSIIRMLMVEQVCRGEVPRVLTEEEVRKYQDIAFRKGVLGFETQKRICDK